MADLIQWFIPFLKEHWGVFVGMGVLWIYGFYHFNARVYQFGKEEEKNAEGLSPKLLALAQSRVAAPPIFTTRRDRYQYYARIYVLGLEGLFLLLVLAPDVFVYMMNLAGQPAPELPHSMDERILWALFGLTGLLSSFPGLRNVEAWVINKLHHLAAIPDQAGLTATTLSKARYRPDSDVRKEAIEELTEPQFQAINFESEELNKLESCFFTVHCLQTKLFKRLRTPKYLVPWQVFELERNALEKELNVRRGQIVTLIDKEQKLETEKGVDINKAADDDTRALLAEHEKETEELLEKERAKLFLKLEVQRYRLCLLASLAAYATEKRSDNIEPVFRELGFDVEIKKLPPIDFETILRIGIVIIVAATVPALFYEVIRDVKGLTIPAEYAGRIPDSFHIAMTWSFAFILLHFIALWGGMKLKRYFSSKRLEKSTSLVHGTPASEFVENAKVFLSFYAVTYVIGCGFFFYFYGLSVFSAGIIWATTPASTAGFVAFYMSKLTEDDYEERKRLYFLYQGIITGGLALMAALVVTHPTDNFDYNSWPDIIWLYAAYASGVSTLIGAGVGWLFPRSYKREIDE
jgi:hypothetical protein